MRGTRFAAAVFVGLLAFPAPACPQNEVDLSAFLAQVQAALQSDSPDAYAALIASPGGAAAARDKAADIYMPGTTRVTLRERDRSPLAGALPDEGFRLMVETLTERGRVARVGTWRLDVRLARQGGERVWRIVDQERLSWLDGLYDLSLEPTEYSVRGLVIDSTDLRLSMASGHAFVARTDQGATALVLRGRGEMVFTPKPASERTQLRIFAGSEALATPFDMAFIRLSPESFNAQVQAGMLTERFVNDSDLRRARDFFQVNVSKSFTLDLGDLSRRIWSLSPTDDDMIAEVHTKRFDMLTYAHSENDPEDISLFDRNKRRYLSSYASPEKLQTRGRFYNEDDLVDYDVLDYRISVTIDPLREWVDGLATITLRVSAPVLTSITLRLEESLNIRSVYSPDFGRLMHLRVVGQSNLIVNLPAAVVQGSELELTVSYAGRVPPQSIEREVISVDPDQEQLPQLVEVAVPPEPHYLYSNRAHWYPQSPVGDYATATLRITVPDGYDCVATGLQAVGSPIRVPPSGQNKAYKIYVFIAGRPVRYLGCVISRFTEVSTGPLDVAPPADALKLTVEANPHLEGRARALRDTAAAILLFYSRLMDGAPYPSFTLALAESQLPGGHSPPYFALLNQPLPTTPYRWRDDPVSFDDFPSFFLAHEIAHQWWGQGLGWANYHEQWLSEGMAQYFAAMYAAQERGPAVFDNLMRQMRTWSLRYSDQGPIYLGYRLGHVKGDSRIFRALVYNKAAVALHMLRRLVGDEAFFAGLRRFYDRYKYRKAGSDDLRRSMEEASGRSLDRFFEQWIYGFAIPRLRFSSQVHAADGGNGASVTVRFEQEGEPFDVPVTVTLVFASGARHDVLVKVTDAVTEVTVPIDGQLRQILVNNDNAALAEISR